MTKNYVNHRSKEYVQLREDQFREKTGLTREQHIKEQKKRALKNRITKR